MLLVKGRVKSDVEVAAVRKLLLKKVACPIAEKIMRHPKGQKARASQLKTC